MMANLILIIVVFICLITDLYNRKIYNVVIFPGLVAAFALHFMLNSWIGLWEALIGFTAGFGILLIPYLLGGMGAGDVKLLALIGALKGPAFVFTAGIYMALLGALIAIAILLFQPGILRRFKVAFYFLVGLRYGIKFPLSVKKESLSIGYPYGVAIAGGAIASLILGNGGWI